MQSELEVDSVASPAPEPVEVLEAGTPAGPQGSELPTVVIQPTHGWRALDLRELWRYRELMFFLTWRDIKVRYKQTVLGAFWAVFQPLMTTGVFVLLFGLLMGRGKEPTVPGVPYALSTFCGLLPWLLFANSLTRAGASLFAGQNLITKVYFPRLILPAAACFSGLVDFAISFVVLIVMMVWYGVVPTWAVLTLPLFMLLAIIASLAVGLWLAVLSTIYRDFRHLQPFIVRIGMYVSPVIYATAAIQSKLPGWALTVYSLNPMVGVIEGFRWALLGKVDPPGLILLPSVLMTVLLFVTALHFFRRMEGTVVDVV